MSKRLKMRPLTEEEQETLERLSGSRTAASRMVERARAVLLIQQGNTPQQRRMAAHIALFVGTVALGRFYSKKINNFLLIHRLRFSRDCFAG